MEDHGAQLQPPAWDMLMIGEERTHSTAHDPAHTCLYNIWKRLLKEVLIPKQLPAKDPFAKSSLGRSRGCAYTDTSRRVGTRSRLGLLELYPVLHGTCPCACVCVRVCPPFLFGLKTAQR